GHAREEHRRVGRRRRGVGGAGRRLALPPVGRGGDAHARRGRRLAGGRVAAAPQRRGLAAPALRHHDRPRRRARSDADAAGQGVAGGQRARRDPARADPGGLPDPHGRGGRARRGVAGAELRAGARDPAAQHRGAQPPARRRRAPPPPL
ncbi:MAG: hypothetical protein AVDCRST_MAG54-1717, partial [uncultured Actinomycetospora sp.]